MVVLPTVTAVPGVVTHRWTAMLEALDVSWLSHSLLTRLAEPPSPTSDPTLEQKTSGGSQQP